MRNLARRKKNIRSDDVGSHQHQYVHGKSFLEERRRRIRGRVPISKRFEVTAEKDRENAKTTGTLKGVVGTSDVNVEKGNDGANVARDDPSADEVLMPAIHSDDKASESAAATALGTFSDGSQVEKGEEEEVGIPRSAEVTEVLGGRASAVVIVGGGKVAQAPRATQPSAETAQVEYSTTQASTQDGSGDLEKYETTASEFSQTEAITTVATEPTTPNSNVNEITTEGLESKVEILDNKDNTEGLNSVPSESRRVSQAVVMPVFISGEVARPYQRHFQRPYQAISEEVVTPTLMSDVFLPPTHHFMLR